MHALLVLDEWHDKIALLEGASLDPGDVVAAGPLLVNRRTRAS
jgi:hypothetical protein